VSLKYCGNMSEPKIGEFLENFDVQVSAGSLSNIRGAALVLSLFNETPFAIRIEYRHDSISDSHGAYTVANVFIKRQNAGIEVRVQVPRERIGSLVYSPIRVVPFGARCLYERPRRNRLSCP
jgi:hypothetical protein